MDCHVCHAVRLTHSLRDGRGNFRPVVIALQDDVDAHHRKSIGDGPHMKVVRGRHARGQRDGPFDLSRDEIASVVERQLNR